jgi:choline dehydrogenase-like flavoprotein
MAEKQTDADKLAAMKEYRSQHDAAVDRMAALKAARLARDAGASDAEVKALATKKKPAAKKAVAKKKKKR